MVSQDGGLTRWSHIDFKCSTTRGSSKWTICRQEHERKHTVKYSFLCDQFSPLNDCPSEHVHVWKSLRNKYSC